MAAALKILPNNGHAPDNASIADHLRQQAEWIEESEDEIRNVYMVIERADGTVYRQVMGRPCDLARALGVMTIACMRGSMGAE